ncbi:MAG: hypothetical protein JO362_22060 [Streptomycetaceae bacterium]|nr:hypothetical protein [Streptomycetaceae bacterium]
MLRDSRRSPEKPEPYDWVQVRPANRAGIDPTQTYLVADQHSLYAYELNHRKDHPDHQDRAAVVDIDDVTLVTRFAETGARSWRPL